MSLDFNNSPSHKSTNSFGFSEFGVNDLNQNSKRKRVRTSTTSTTKADSAESIKKLSSEFIQKNEQNHEEFQAAKKFKPAQYIENVVPKLTSSTEPNRANTTETTNPKPESSNNSKNNEESLRKLDSKNMKEVSMSEEDIDKEDIEYLKEKLVQTKKPSKSIEVSSISLDLNEFQNVDSSLFLYRKNERIYIDKLSDSNTAFFLEQRAKGNVAYIVRGQSDDEPVKVLGSEKFFEGIKNPEDLKIFAAEGAGKEVKEFLERTTFQFYKLDQVQIEIVNKAFARKNPNIELEEEKNKEKDKLTKSKRKKQTTPKEQPDPVKIKPKEKVTKIEIKEDHRITREDIEEIVKNSYYSVKVFREENLEKRKKEFEYKVKSKECQKKAQLSLRKKEKLCLDAFHAMQCYQKYKS